MLDRRAYGYHSPEALLITVASAVLVFLLVERWKTLEMQIGELRKGQADAFKDVRQQVDDLVKSKIEDTVRRTQSIENRITNLLEEHPWVGDISELETIPDSKMCRLVLATAQEMYTTDRVLLCYEYLSSVASSQLGLEGTGRDFLELSTFCEVWLDDEYLAYRIITQGLQCATAASELADYCLRSAIRFGDRKAASQLARQLRIQVDEAWWRRLLKLPEDERVRRRDLVAQARAALSLYEAAFGRSDRAQKYRSQAQGGSTDATGAWNKTLELELNLLLGRPEGVDKLAAEIGSQPPGSGLPELEVIRALRRVGRTKEADEREKLLEAQLFERMQGQGRPQHALDIPEQPAPSASGNGTGARTSSTGPEPSRVPPQTGPDRPSPGIVAPEIPGA